MKELRISVRLSKKSRSQLDTICEKYQITKTMAIENVIDSFFEKMLAPSTTLKESIEKHFIPSPAEIVNKIKSEYPTILRDSIDDHAEEIIQESIDLDKKVSVPAFHLGGEIVRFENRFVKKGELADARYNENINIRDIMRAYRYKIKGKSYDESMEQYFDLLTEDYKNMVNGKTS